MEELLQDLKYLHSQLAKRDCASTTLIKSMAQLGKPFEEACASAMCPIRCSGICTSTTISSFNMKSNS